jgi:uncharacterized membrane protein
MKLKLQGSCIHSFTYTHRYKKKIEVIQASIDWMGKLNLRSVILLSATVTISVFALLVVTVFVVVVFWVIVFDE